jgi:outer membrane protein OmpA-like peptidoglycan-associated protein
MLACGLAACTTSAPVASQKFPIFFTAWSASLDDDGAAVVAAAAARAKQNPTLQVNVAGYADPDGSPAANKAVSLTRAQVVVDQLVADGIDRGRIVRSAHGETAFVLNSQESRRVDISIGG